MTERLPSLYIPHGGGPCFFMEPMPGMPPGLWHKMAEYLASIASSLPSRPDAVLVISAHWEAPRPTVGAAAQHSLLFDYYGFPEHTCHLTYPVAGCPALAARVRDLLRQAGIDSDADERRGIDHGVFIPFKLIYPKADIPIVPLSLRQDLDARAHMDVGAALARLRDEGVLIVGSGMSYHNLRELFRPDAQANEAARQFDRWLASTVAMDDASRRQQALVDWRRAPGALASHPRAEHLLPLMVAAGAAGPDPGRIAYSDNLLGKAISAVQFG
jgi:aromatic ring-opening dioxygenase catalytic subunit (LigB family)